MQEVGVSEALKFSIVVAPSHINTFLLQASSQPTRMLLPARRGPSLSMVQELSMFLSISCLESRK